MHPETEGTLIDWHKTAKSSRWTSPHDVQRDYPSARPIGRERVIFNILGNRHRLVVKLNYRYGKAYVRFIGTHAEYDRINPLEI